MGEKRRAQLLSITVDFWGKGFFYLILDLFDDITCAFLYDGSQMLDLCLLTDCTSYGWERLRFATDINDNGDIAGTGMFNGE